MNKTTELKIEKDLPCGVPKLERQNAMYLETWQLDEKEQLKADAFHLPSPLDSDPETDSTASLPSIPSYDEYIMGLFEEKETIKTANTIFTPLHLDNIEDEHNGNSWDFSSDWTKYSNMNNTFELCHQCDDLSCMHCPFCKACRSCMHKAHKVA